MLKSLIQDNTERENEKILFVLNKADLLRKTAAFDIISGQYETIKISCVTGDRLNSLEETLTNKAMKSLNTGKSGDPNSIDEGSLITRERHRHHLTECMICLDAFLSSGLPPDAAAEELRIATLELGKVTGRVDVEELLDIIFRDFCIGK